VTITKRQGAVLGLTAGAYFMAVLDSLVVITALPRMQADLHVGLSTLQWTVNSYGIAVAAGIIAAAALGDRLGRRRVFVAGIVLFTVASAACALATSAGVLIAARTVQGLGGATILPLSLTILTGAFPIERRGMVVGLYGGLAGLAVAAGPLVGGAVTQGLDWHWIFWINVPIGIVVATLSARLLPESFGPDSRLDIAGVALVSAGATAVVWGLTRSTQAGWGSPETLVALVGGLFLLGGFVFWESRAAAPMVPLTLFRRRDFAAGNVTLFLMSGAIFAAAFMIMQYAQVARGYSPLGTGVRLLPWLITPIFISPIAGAISDRIGRRPVITTGLTLQALGFGWVAVRAHPTTPFLELVVALFVAGVGISMALPTAPTAVLSSVPPQDLGKASGVSNMSQRFGAVMAIAVTSAVFSGSGHFGSPLSFTDGFRPALFVCAAFSLLGALSSLALKPSGATLSLQAGSINVKGLPARECEPAEATSGPAA
jgi:EmrB/QacA subfamily drug resistance transporter